jgi:hypothetical protein
LELKGIKECFGKRKTKEWHSLIPENAKDAENV